MNTFSPSAAALVTALDEDGFACLPGLLDAATCTAIRADFDDDGRYRATVDMARYQFGCGIYRYFSYPLPPAVGALRKTFYPVLAEIANLWETRLGRPPRFPVELEPYLDHCHAQGQTRPTPLLLRYRANDYNCLHQDLYGAEVFPLQMAVLLSAPGDEFGGGEFVLTEQRPRRQSRVSVVPLMQGDAVVFPVARRPAAGTRGWHQVNLRHGVSRVTAGERYTLGVIFHDAA